MSGEETLTIKQITRELDVDDKTVRRWIKSGQLSAERDIVGHYSILRSELDRFIAERRKKFSQNPGRDV
ncbi:MAG TPA: helix-turn-helix domain-containing protein [Ktedonobacteraceae bacterium]|nr:helix-turn-helix domain-containing protein [Ktedonobacteraceae bacterium]